jgi:hypothetical protein
MDHDKPAATLGIGFDKLVFDGREISPDLPMNDDHIRLGQFLRGWKKKAAGNLRPAVGEELAPVPQERRVVVVARPVRLRPGTDEDPERTGFRGGSGLGLKAPAGEKEGQQERHGCHETAAGKVLVK